MELDAAAPRHNGGSYEEDENPAESLEDHGTSERVTKQSAVVTAASPSTASSNFGGSSHTNYQQLVFTSSTIAPPQTLATCANNHVESNLGFPYSRPSRESVLQRLSEALLRRSLTKIDLSQRGLIASDARLVRMAVLQNAHLTILKLGYNQLDDEGAQILASGLAKHGALESLDLGFNNIGDVGCQALATAIRSPPLHTLYLAGNCIGSDGAVALADLLRRENCSVHKLFLMGNCLGPEGVTSIVDAIIEAEQRRVDEEMVAASSAAEEKEAATESSFPLPHFPTSASTSLHANNTRFTGMQELFLGGTKPGSVGCQALARLLATTTSLRVLSLPNCEFGNAEIQLLAASIKAHRETLPLQSLQLSFNRISCKGMEYLANAIWGWPTLRDLRLDNNEIADRGAQQLAAVLTLVPQLETLDVGFNVMQPTGIKLLMKAVAETKRLQSLSVSGNRVDDANAAKAIAYALAHNRSLLSLSVVHCSIGHEGRRHISAGIVSNRGVALRDLSGFDIGPVVVSLGFPPPIGHWSNEQVLNFIRTMWDKCRQEVLATAEEEKVMDPLHFLPFNNGNHSHAAGSMSSSLPVDAAQVVEVAKKAFGALVEEGVDVFSRRPGHPNQPSYASPIAGDSIVVEKTFDKQQQTQSMAVNGENSIAQQLPELLPATQARSFVAAPAESVGKQALSDPSRKKRIVEWLCNNIQNLNKLAQQPFSSAELWKLHQHYFTPVINESGGNVLPSPSQYAGSVPEVTSAGADSHPADSMDDSMDDSFPGVPMSDPSMKQSPIALASLPMLKRKVSYRFLGDASMANGNATTPFMPPAPLAALSVSSLITGGPTSHTLPRKTKRARRNRARIFFLPRVKAKLDGFLDVCHEKALVTMRQLYYVEQAILRGEVNPIDPSTTTRTHLAGDFAADAEVILVDMI